MDYESIFKDLLFSFQEYVDVNLGVGLSFINFYEYAGVFSITFTDTNGKIVDIKKFTFEIKKEPKRKTYEKFGQKIFNTFMSKHAEEIELFVKNLEHA